MKYTHQLLRYNGRIIYLYNFHLINILKTIRVTLEVLGIFLLLNFFAKLIKYLKSV